MRLAARHKLVHPKPRASCALCTMLAKPMWQRKRVPPPTPPAPAPVPVLPLPPSLSRRRGPRRFSFTDGLPVDTALVRAASYSAMLSFVLRRVDPMTPAEAWHETKHRGWTSEERSRVCSLLAGARCRFDYSQDQRDTMRDLPRHAKRYGAR